MALMEFSEKFISNLGKADGDLNSRLKLSRRNSEKPDQSFFYPMALKPFLTERNANPKSPNHWFYCKAICMSVLPCNTIDDLLPTTTLSDKDLKDYWITKYKTAFADDTSLLPKWARAYHVRYHCEQSSSSSDSESDSDHDIETNKDSSDTKSSSHSSSESSEEDMDPDPRAKRTKNAFYQNIEDQLDSRQINEPPPDVIGQIPEYLEKSNPRGENFQAWAEGSIMPPYERITSSLNALKSQSALPEIPPDAQLNDKQRLFKDMIHNWVQKWDAAKNNGDAWPKPLRMFS